MFRGAYSRVAAGGGGGAHSIERLILNHSFFMAGAYSTRDVSRMDGTFYFDISITWRKYSCFNP